MKYYKILANPGPEYEYYEVRDDDSYHWYHDQQKRWYRALRGDATNELWIEWLNVWRPGAAIEVSKLEVLVVCGCFPNREDTI